MELVLKMWFSYQAITHLRIWGFVTNLSCRSCRQQARAATSVLVDSRSWAWCTITYLRIQAVKGYGNMNEWWCPGSRGKTTRAFTLTLVVSYQGQPSEAVNQLFQALTPWAHLFSHSVLEPKSDRSKMIPHSLSDISNVEWTTCMKGWTFSPYSITFINRKSSWIMVNSSQWIHSNHWAMANLSISNSYK